MRLRLYISTKPYRNPGRPSQKRSCTLDKTGSVWMDIRYRLTVGRVVSRKLSGNSPSSAVWSKCKCKLQENKEKYILILNLATARIVYFWVLLLVYFNYCSYTVICRTSDTDRCGSHSMTESYAYIYRQTAAMHNKLPEISGNFPVIKFPENLQPPT